jgi:hypothetical protein
MFALFMEKMRPGPQTTVLDVGVTSDVNHPESNYFEQWYPYPHNITCVGTEDGSHLASRYPGLTYRQTRDGEPLPFRDGEFDIVFSNAVLEHVGRAAQGPFVRETCRVGKRFFITTPDRLFPFEHHTGLPLLHYLPPAIFRRLLAKTRHAHWSLEANLNILTNSELAALFSGEPNVTIHRIRFMGIPSNLVALGSIAAGSQG